MTLRENGQERTSWIMATRSDSISHKPGKHSSAVLGRSAATGRYVMMPASKAGSVSVEKAKAAVKNVNSSKK